MSSPCRIEVHQDGYRNGKWTMELLQRYVSTGQPEPAPRQIRCPVYDLEH